MSLVALAFFLSHIPVTLFVDSQAGKRRRERGWMEERAG